MSKQIGEWKEKINKEEKIYIDMCLLEKERERERERGEGGRRKNKENIYSYVIALAQWKL